MRMRMNVRSGISSAIVPGAVACGGGTADEGGTAGDSFLDEPLPTGEQLGNAADCDELNRLMAGVENENFRVNADRSLAEEDAAAEDEYESYFDVYYVAFSDRQADIGRSDAEMMSVLETASDQRCEAWLADGHGLDEEPLLLNTAAC